MKSITVKINTSLDYALGDIKSILRSHIAGKLNVSEVKPKICKCKKSKNPVLAGWCLTLDAIYCPYCGGKIGRPK